MRQQLRALFQIPFVGQEFPMIGSQRIQCYIAQTSTYVLLVSCDINRKRMYASASELSGCEGVCS